MTPDADPRCCLGTSTGTTQLSGTDLEHDLAAQNGAIRQELVPAASDDLNGPPA